MMITKTTFRFAFNIAAAVVLFSLYP